MRTPPPDNYTRAIFWREEVEHWPPERQIDWGERAAIREYDGGYPRAQAEELAYLDLTKAGRQT